MCGSDGADAKPEIAHVKVDDPGVMKVRRRGSLARRVAGARSPIGGEDACW